MPFFFIISLFYNKFIEELLAHRRTISALSLYYRYFHGVCSVELKSIIPPKAVFTRNTRFSNAQHPFAVKLDKNSSLIVFFNFHSFINLFYNHWVNSSKTGLTQFSSLFIRWEILYSFYSSLLFYLSLQNTTRSSMCALASEFFIILSTHLKSYKFS